jgi:hypothetical protein
VKTSISLPEPILNYALQKAASEFTTVSALVTTLLLNQKKVEEKVKIPIALPNESKTPTKCSGSIRA